MTDIWRPERFLIAHNSSFERTAGYTYRGLGLRMVICGSPKGLRPPTWKLIHLGTGHSICSITGKVAGAFPIATEIAEAGDWDWDGLQGWLNRDPELPARVLAIIGRHPKRCQRREGNNSNEEAARAIAIARAR